MFQYLISGLATGATLVLYEGSPLKRPDCLWRMVDDLGITIFGTSAKYIEQISKHYPEVGAKHDLSTLRQILSTGSPLPPGLFDFVYDKVKKDVLLGSITGTSLTLRSALADEVSKRSSWNGNDVRLVLHHRWRNGSSR